MDSSISISNYGSRSQQNQQQQIKSNKISNRQKILNLHQRIKMLDQINLSEADRNVSFNLQNLKSQSINEVNSQQSPDQQRPLQYNKSFLKRSISPNPPQSNLRNGNFSNLSNFFRSRNEKSNEKQNFSTSNLHKNIEPLNNSLLNKSQHSVSASRLPSYSPSPKNFQESQKVSNSIYRGINPMGQFYPLEARYLSIQDKFLQFKTSQQNLLKNIYNEIQQLQQNCKQMKKQHEKTQKRNEQIINSLEKSLLGEINDLSIELKQVKKGAIESLDTKHKAIRCETIAMISEEFETQCKNSSTQIQMKLQTTQKILEKEQTLRDETAEFLINSFGDEIIKLEEVFNNQREARIRKNDELLKLINNIEDQLMDRIQKQKNDMVSTIEDMENMLEQVCYKIQQKILGN